MSEIAYAINSQATNHQDYLILELIEVVKEGYHYQVKSTIEKRSVSQWRALAQSPVDKEALTFLIKEEFVFQKKSLGKTPQSDSFILTQLHISSSQVYTALQFLAPTQKLYCKGKRLTIDLYGKTEFYYVGIPLHTGQLEIQGHLRWRDIDILLSECEVIIPGKPYHWFVRDINLKMISTSISWKKLQELKNSSFLLEARMKQKFLDELDPTDPDIPCLFIQQGSIEEVKQSIQPYPLLKLKDRWGACADLWMDYGQGHLIAYHDPSTVIKDDQGHVLFKRQLDTENNWEKDLLETNYIKKIVSTSHYYCSLDCTAKSIAFLIEIGWSIQDCENRQVIKQTAFNLYIDNQAQALVIKGSIHYETYEADLKQILGTFNRREHFIQLSSDTVGLFSLDIPQQTLKDLAQEGEWIANELHVKKSRFGALEQVWQHAQHSPSLSSLKDKWENFKGIQEALPSSDFQGNLRFYQQQGVNWLSFLNEYGFHGILADEMGLGKTVQVLAFLSRLPRNAPHLIVMPTSLLFNWRNEIQQFLPQWSCYVHQGEKRKKTKEEIPKVDVMLTSYATLRLDLSLLQSFNYSCLVLDEAQVIKNAYTQTAKAVCQIHAQQRLSLTGTPIENHLQELWSHFHFLIPDLLDSYEKFESDLQAAQSDKRYLERIKRKISPFILRRRKQEVAADLPARLEQTVWIEMPEEQQKIYDQLLAGFKQGLIKKVENEGIGKHRLEILEAILRLRQVCCHPLLVSSLIEEEQNLTSAKFNVLLQDLETIVQEGHKVLIYSQFTSMLHLMTKAANERQWAYGYLDGQTKNREEVVTRFQHDPTQFLFFISLRAGGVGLNLTAADYVYLYDPWWNEALEEQAINRAHRIGRKDSVMAKRLIISESIEEKMMKLKASKRLVIDDLFDTEMTSTQLNLDDLYYLLS